MATVTRTRINLTTRVTLELDETEVRALDGIFGYNVDAFLKVFYERMGTAYVQRHEAGVRSLHHTIRSTLSPSLLAIDKARAALLQSVGPES